jgi:hypothetical protein
VIIGVFMAAYSIPVTFHTVMSVAGSNSISNTVAVTPGGAGVNQVFNVAALGDVTIPRRRRPTRSPSRSSVPRGRCCSASL